MKYESVGSEEGFGTDEEDEQEEEEELEEEEEDEEAGSSAIQGSSRSETRVSGCIFILNVLCMIGF